MRFMLIVVFTFLFINQIDAQFFRESGLREIYVNMDKWDVSETGNPVDGFTRTAWIARQYEPSTFFQVEYNKHSNGNRSLVVTNISLMPNKNYKVLIGFDKDDEVFSPNWIFNIGGMFQFPNILIRNEDISESLISKIRSSGTLHIIVRKESSAGFITDKTYTLPLSGSTNSIDFVNRLVSSN